MLRLRPDLKRQPGQLNVLTTELHEFEGGSQRRSGAEKLQRFWELLMPVRFPATKEDPYHDLSESDDKTSGHQQNNIEFPSLKECQRYLKNDEAERYQARTSSWYHMVSTVVLDVTAALFLYIANTFSLASGVAVGNAVGATYFYCSNSSRWSAKLDFSILAFSVVFPLSFLMQSAFARRDQALQRLADFKSAYLATALFTLTCDWATNDSPTQGRKALPDKFNAVIVKDFRQLLQLVYEYLSMPNVSHARHVVFRPKQKLTRRVHALQNDITTNLNDSMFALSMHTEALRKFGFPSGEASRLHQYHQYVQQRFEQLRILKYYRNPQAARSFGLAYILILPWVTGPYYAWVYEETNQDYAFALTLAGFTSLVLIGLLNTTYRLEDPFISYHFSWTPGIDNVKLEFECAVMLQALEQYYANTEAQRRMQTESSSSSLHQQQVRLATTTSTEAEKDVYFEAQEAV